MAEKSILLIGNGPSVLDYEIGKKIDLFPTICRFNAFKIKGYEKFVGAKTNMWVTCLGKEDVIKRQKEFEKIYFPLWQKTYLELCKIIPNSECFTEEVYKNAGKILGKYFYPSSGLLATMYFLSKNIKIYIHGFDFFQKERHHYCDSQTVGKNHNPKMEKEAFQKLLEENKIWKFINYDIQ